MKDARKSPTLVQSFVFNRHVFEFEVEREHASRTMSVAFTNSDGTRWSFVEPAWADLSFGADAGWFYWWSARRLIALRPDESPDEPWLVETDEDALYAFPLDGACFLLICETSVRLIRHQREVDRVELPEVISEVRWMGATLRVADRAGQAYDVRVIGTETLEVTVSSDPFKFG
jgi:hypothetical protein